MAAQTAAQICAPNIVIHPYVGRPKTQSPRSTAGLKNHPDMPPTEAIPTMTTAPIARPK